MIARGTGTLTSRSLARTRKPQRTTAHVWATANCIAVTSAERSRADTTPNLGSRLIKTIAIIATSAAIVTATITTTTIAARIAVAATGIVTAATEVLSIFAKPR